MGLVTEPYHTKELDVKLINKITPKLLEKTDSELLRLNKIYKDGPGRDDVCQILTTKPKKPTEIWFDKMDPKQNELKPTAE